MSSYYQTGHAEIHDKILTLRLYSKLNRTGYEQADTIRKGGV